MDFRRLCSWRKNDSMNQPIENCWTVVKNHTVIMDINNEALFIINKPLTLKVCLYVLRWESRLFYEFNFKSRHKSLISLCCVDDDVARFARRPMCARQPPDKRTIVFEYPPMSQRRCRGFQTVWVDETNGSWLGDEHYASTTMSLGRGDFRLQKLVCCFNSRYLYSEREDAACSRKTNEQHECKFPDF